MSDLILSDNINNVNSLCQIITKTLKNRPIEGTFTSRVKEKLELYKAYIPHELFYEVEDLVKTNYKNDWDLYLQDIQQYFYVITLEKFTIANADYKELKGLTNHFMSSGRSAKALQRKILNHCSVLLKIVGFNASHYVSKSQLNEYKKSVAKQQEFIKSQSLINKDGYVISLANATKTKEQYMAEKINCIKTMELFAVDKGFTWSFITLTLDKNEQGSYHPNPKFRAVGHVYNGVSPADSARLLMSEWNTIRALLLKKGLKPSRDFFGSVTSEAHVGGLRHIHILMFHHVDDLEMIRKCFFTVKPNLQIMVFNAEMKKNQLDFKLINMDITADEYKKQIKKIRNPWQLCDQSKIQDKSKLGAVNYIYKYVMKSTANFDVNLDVWKQDDELHNATMQNCAFRNALGIRGVSFFGFESCLSKFRFLARNLKKLTEDDGIYYNKISYRLEQIIQDNDLYSFISESHFNLIKNKYIETSPGNKKLIGVIIDNVSYLKNIFKMANTKAIQAETESKNNSNNKNIFQELALIAFNELMVLVTHNDSSKSEKTKNKFKIIKIPDKPTDFYFNYGLDYKNK